MNASTGFKKAAKLLLKLFTPCLVLGGAIARLSVVERDDRFVLVDSLGRERLLRGVNLATLGGRSEVPIDPALYANGGCPANNQSWYQPPICYSDIVELKSLGFDVIRLLVHWSQIEPNPGTYNLLYFQRINQILDWAETNGVAVLIDFHQDNFAEHSTTCCADDGAPAWAWLVNESALTPAEKVEIAIMKRLIPQLDWAGAEVAFHAFWTNRIVPNTGIGLQTHYIQAVSAMVNATMHRDGVIGYEIMNEPLPGLDIRLIQFSADRLYPFYARVIQALTGVRDGKPSCPCNISPGTATVALRVTCVPAGKESSPVSDACAYPDLDLHTDKLMVFEPMAVRNQLDVSLQISGPFSEYSNLVYAPHTYTQSFTLDKREPFWVALGSALPEAFALHAALMVTEWGGDSLANVRSIAQQHAEHAVSGIHWVWKQNGGGGWSLHETTDGERFTVRTGRLNWASRIHPLAIAGRLLRYGQDNRTFWMQARCNASLGPSVVTTTVYFPGHFVECASSIIVTGDATLASLEHREDGSAIASIVCRMGSNEDFGLGCDFPAGQEQEENSVGQDDMVVV